MFIPRHPVVENQFCSYAAQTDTSTEGVGGVIAYAGSVVYLVEGSTNQEAEVLKATYVALTTNSYAPFGFSMQKVKTGYHQVHPAGFFMPGDLGSSDVIAQPTYSSAGAITGTKATPVGVAHLGIWDTVHYTAKGTGTGATDITPSAAILPGEALYTAVDQAKLTNNATVAASDSDLSTGENAVATIVARVVKGASVAKATANIANTTLYPIRVKLLI
jgi:hypothetical protein